MLVFYYNIFVINCFYDNFILYSYPEVVYRYLCIRIQFKLQNYKFSTPKKMVLIVNNFFSLWITISLQLLV